MLPASADEARFLAELWRDALDKRVPPELVEALVGHLLAITTDGPIEVRHAAFHATLRRLKAAVRDTLRVTQAPPRGEVLGTYATGVGRKASRPYATRVIGVSPLEGSCNCPDFTRNALGLCKHLLVAWAHLANRPQAWRRALRQQVAPRVGLRFHPLRPLTGPGDWLERVEAHGSPPSGPGPWVEVRPHVFRPQPGSTLRPETRARWLTHLKRSLRRDVASADPALRALVDEELETLERVQAIALSRQELSRHLRGVSRRLYPYQREGVDRFFTTGRLLLADDMGLGKTTQAISICHAAFASGKVQRGLLIVPASLKYQWAREWRATTRTPLTVVEGPREARQAFWRKPPRGFLLAHYEQAVRDLPSLKDVSLDLVVLDEAQRIKNWEAKTSAAIKQLTPPYRLVLTGTPMENRLDELASILEWVDDRALEPRWRLVPFHTVPATVGSAGGARNLDTLRERLAPVFLRRVREQVLAQLPARTDTRIPVPLTPEQLAAHSELDLPIARLAAIARRRPLLPAEFLRLMGLLANQRIICNGLGLRDFESTWPGLEPLASPPDALLRSLQSPKLLELRELVRSVCVEQGRKVVIFSQWRRMLLLAWWALRDILGEAGLRGVFFTGQESLHQRTRSVEDFHDDARTRVFLATDAGGVGLNLQRAANCLIHLDLPWNPAVLEQRVGRIHRMGQVAPIDVYSLVSAEGIEARIAQVVEDKRALFTGLFDGTSDAVEYQRAQTLSAQLERLVDLELVSAAEASPLTESPEEEELQEAASLGAGAGPDSASDRTGTSSPGADGVAPAAAGEPPGADQVAQLFSRVQVRTTPEGGLVLEAPPEAASTLAALFRGMAGLLDRGAPAVEMTAVRSGPFRSGSSLQAGASADPRGHDGAAEHPS